MPTVAPYIDQINKGCVNLMIWNLKQTEDMYVLIGGEGIFVNLNSEEWNEN